jgi:hypothetical protein
MPSVTQAAPHSRIALVVAATARAWAHLERERAARERGKGWAFVGGISLG